MKSLKKVPGAVGIAAVLAGIPLQTANSYWWGGPGYNDWRNAYVYDPAYRWGPPQTKSYIRDLHLYGPDYALWRQNRRLGWW